MNNGTPAYALPKSTMSHDEVIAANTSASGAYPAGVFVTIPNGNTGRVCGHVAGMVEVATRDGVLCFKVEDLEYKVN